MSHEVSSVSIEYVIVPVTVSRGGQPYDPTDDTVRMAFPVHGDVPITWFAAAWQTIGRTHRVRCLIGPGTTVGTLAAGTYDVYVKITDTPEVPVIRAVDTLLVT